MSDASTSITRPLRLWDEAWRYARAHPWVDPHYPTLRPIGLAWFVLTFVVTLVAMLAVLDPAAMLDPLVVACALVFAATDMMKILDVHRRELLVNDVFAIVPFAFLTVGESAALILWASILRIVLRPASITRLLARESSRTMSTAWMLLGAVIGRELMPDGSWSIAVIVITAFLVDIVVNDMLLFPVGVRLAIGPQFRFREHWTDVWFGLGVVVPIEIPVAVLGAYGWHHSPALLLGVLVPYVAIWHLSQARSQLREMQDADELKSRFFAMASHEVRTPLTSIAGFADTLLQRWDSLDDEDKRTYVGIISEQAQRLTRLTGNLLLLSRMEAGRLDVQPARVDVREVLDAAVTAQLDPASYVVSCPDAVHALVDADHLRQMIDNYLVNAVRYGAAPYEVSVSPSDGSVTIRVTDHGSGVSSEFEDELFETFTRADDAEAATVEGAGLGLSIVRRLAEANGGAAWYEPATVHSGHAFVVRIPRDADESAG